jgi:hypothetical protein
MALSRLSQVSAQTSATGAFWGIKGVEQLISISLVESLFLGWIWGF